MAGEDKLREYLKRVTVELTDARRRLAETQDRGLEPIAVIGMSCRFPGAENADAYWRLLSGGESGVLDEVPDQRFDLDPWVADESVYTRRGAFLPDITGWDAKFFRSSPREALRMDPQQRLLMELAWEAMENAGTPPTSLAGSRTGVLVGFSDIMQYAQLETQRQGTVVLTDPYIGQGSSASVVAGRIAYHFDLRGPAMAVDTACSSSLVAVHLAADALRRGECDLALAGGGFLAMLPDLYIHGCATSMLSRSGECRTFDAAADGYVLGEGGGLVVLARLSDAVRAGHRIRAVIRGSAVNQDGRTNGLTAPNRSAQVDVIRRALSAARISPEQVDFLEAHGSATPLGDQIELSALNEVFGARSPQRPLHVGAVKTNIGHTQAAAGAAGLIKTILVLENGVVPPNLNMTEPAEATMANGTVRPAAGTIALPDGGRSWLAGVSSFGWSGTNAHLVLESAPAAESGPADTEQAAELLPVSASGEAALHAHLARLAAGAGDCALADLAYTLQTGRAQLDHRRAVVAADAGDAVAQLSAAGGAPGVRCTQDQPRLAFLLPGAVGQAGGAELYRGEPAFTAAVDECISIASERCGLDLRPALFGDSSGQTAVAHLSLFTSQFALARLLAHYGVRPDLLISDGVGDLVAACLAGVLSLADALLVVAERAGLGQTADSSPLAAILASVSWQPAVGAVIASRSGPPLTADQVTSPQYWLDRLSAPPRKAAGSQLRPAHGVDACVVLGAGQSPADLRHPDAAAGQPLVLGTLPHAAADERAALLRTCGRLWELGVDLDWNALRRGNGRLTELPSYPFQRERYWIELPVAPVPAATVPAATEAVATEAVADRPAVSAGTSEHVQLLTQHWSPAQDAAAAPATGRYLLIADAEGIADALGVRLRDDGAEVVLRQELGTQELGSGDLTGGPVTVVDLSTLDRSASDQAEGGVVSVAGLLAALGGEVARTTRVVVVTRGGHAVTADEHVRPAQAAVAVLPIIANQEYVNIDARGVDLDPACSVTAAADVLVAELRGASAEPQSAYRADRRHVLGYVPLGEPAGVASYAGGTYLITGGLGDIGLTIAEHLVRRGAARVVLTSRRGAPAGPRNARHDTLDRLRGLGAEVTTPAVDVTDPASMRALFAARRVDGVVHAAADAAADTFRSLRDLDETSVARQFGAKVDGARVLAEVFGGLPAGHAPDWCMAFSSTSALLGGATFGGYAAANAALAALGRSTSGGGTRWIAANWDTWACTLDKLGGGIGASLVSHSMSDAEALDAFDRLVARAPRAAVVAAGGLTDRLPRPYAVTEPTVGTDIRHPRPDLQQPYSPPLTPAERAMAGLWAEILGVEPVGIRDNFFDLGGTSLLAPQLFTLIKKRFGIALPTVTLFEAPTVRALAGALDRQRAPQPAAAQPAVAQAIAPQPAAAQAIAAPVSPELAAPAEPVALAGRIVSLPAGPAPDLDRRIAIIGMAGRFPGAGDVAEFWRNLRGGVESISFFTPEELIAAGVGAEQVHDPLYVPARPVLDDIAGFDAAFFGMSPRMAALTDPQQRLFLEVCWEALEQAGHCQSEHQGRVGVYGGTHISTYLLGMQDQLDDDVSSFEIGIGNEKDALTTSVSYLFDLHGPSVAVQTFCSTSLVAAHLAVQSLRSGECEMALAGGVSIRVPDRVGHRYEQGGMESPDGHVRTFDAKARGSMFGDGATVVVLKRLADALRDGDHVWAVIRGSAMNNDGALKVGFTAPSVTGQAEVITAAMADAGVTAQEVGYVEAHGSGTPLGDPIEVAALTRAFGPTPARQYCALGSVKTNIGHLDRASGTAGLIKTSLTLWDGVIPPTLHFTTPNPEIDFENSPFFVNNAPLPWAPDSGRPRIAGLNSLGMGGTNVHMVLEQPPATPRELPGDPDSERRYQVLPVSARTVTAADASCRRLGEHLRANPGVRLADVAYTLQAGRKVFEHRRAAVATSVADAAATLTGANDADPAAARTEAAQGRPVAFLFAGVGEQYPGMIGELYRREPVFRSLLKDCLDRLAGQLPGVDMTGLLTEGSGSGGPSLAALLGRGSDSADAATAQLQRTEVVQPLMFAVDYALAGTLMAWGVRPAAMLGYSLGEYVAACLAGVLSLQDALKLVVHRARLISAVEPGSMAGIQLGADDLHSRFQLEGRGLDIASVNGPQTVVAGPTAAVTQLLADLREAKIAGRRLQTTHAFHSRMLAPLAAELTAWIAANIRLSPPTLSYFSNVTGAEADAALVCDPGYWARHMCQPVQFSAGVGALLADPELAVIEIGPGRSLTSLIRAAGCPPAQWPLMTATLPAASDSRPADAVFADCLARLWLIGVDVDWLAYHGRRPEARPAYAGSPPGRIPLPTYPFERQRYWIERTAQRRNRSAELPTGPATFDDVDRLPRLPEEQWLNLPMWRQVAPAAAGESQPASWLVFAREGEAGRVLTELRRAAESDGATLTVVRPGDCYRMTPDGFAVRPGSADDALEMLRQLRQRTVPLDRAVHLWTLDEAPGGDDATVALGLNTLVALARATGELGLTGWSLDIVTAGTQQVVDGGMFRPAAATVVGAARVIPLEYPSVVTRLIDVHPGTAADQVVGELRRPLTEPTVALRGGRRWLCGYQNVPAVAMADTGAVLRENGVYLITGGLGGIGLSMAEHLARDCRARLVLFGRRGLPPREQWAGIATGERAAEDSVRGRVARVLEIVALGAEVEVVSGDVAEPADVRRAVDRAHELFGGLHGVLHAAGVPGTGLMQFKEPSDSAQVLAPKLAGTRAIAEALRIGEPDETALDFLVLFSSIASATGGGPGQVDYCGANAYLDVYAAQLAATGRRALSVDWGEWVWNAWEEGLEGYDDALHAFFQKHRANFGIMFEEGWRTLLRALASGESRVVVSTQDLPSILRFSAGFTVEAVTAPGNTSSAGERHPRPELVTPYQEPSGETQRTIAALWSQALRLDRIGAADNFFELGGNSLLGIALLAQLRVSFTGADLAPHILHEAPSVAALARIVDRAGGDAPPEPERDGRAQGQLRRAGLKAAAARRARS